MIANTVVNGALGWIMVVTFCICLGNVTEVLASPTGYPYIQVFYNATNSTTGTTILIAFQLAMGACGCLTGMAAASRQLWSFSRDKAVPGSNWLSVVKWELPLHSILVTFVTTSVLSLINISSALALNSIVSLSVVALLSSYMCSIGCITWQRIARIQLPRSKFSLGN